jgi:putative endonuclease
MKDPRKPSTREQGLSAEQLACAHLERRGLRLLERNYRTPFGEIDLVMQDGAALVFVEVRLRRGSDFGGPAASIDRRKRERLRASAQHYLQRQARAGRRPCRFDVVALTGPAAAPVIEWLPNAFEA